MAGGEAKGSGSGEFKLGELYGAVAAMQHSVNTLVSTVTDTNRKVDSIVEQLTEGTGKFKDLEHQDNLLELRLKAIEAANEKSANTKQSVVMMLLDKAIGVALPWGAVAYMLWGKTP
jgi:hypothetical protein